MLSDLPLYYCKRIKKSVVAEKPGDITERVYVQCKFYDLNRARCETNSMRKKKCLVNLTVKEE
jgi:hypothetical protein